MKQLLINIQNRLTSQMDAVRDCDIFFTPDHNLIPKTAKLPCIGIKDGNVKRIDLIGSATETRLPVEISVYREFFFRDSDIEALFDICDAVIVALKEYYFNDYVTEISVGDESGIEWMVDSETLIIRKILFFNYTREE